MKRAGFTMIELIFVIVILGILSAVALPKFIGVSEQAQASRCQAVVGTLNRTVGPAMWSDSLLNGNGGSLIAGTAAPYDSAAHAAAELVKQIDLPADCNASVAANWFSTTPGGGGTITIGSKSYKVAFTDGNATSAAIWEWIQQ